MLAHEVDGTSATFTDLLREYIPLYRGRDDVRKATRPSLKHASVEQPYGLSHGEYTGRESLWAKPCCTDVAFQSALLP